MSRSHGNRSPAKDMYWFAHGGLENTSDKCLNQRNNEFEEDGSDSSSPTLKSSADRRGLPDDQRAPYFSDGANSSAPSSLEFKDERSKISDRRSAVEERRKQLLEAEQERNEAVMRKHIEREAALEARRNAQRSTISFAFGSSVPRNVDTLQGGDPKPSTSSGLYNKEENHDINRDRRSVSPLHSIGSNCRVDSSSPQPISYNFNERKIFSPSCWLVGSGALIGGGDDVMSKSMHAAIPTPRGRRKNDLMPAIPYDRTPVPKSSSTSTRKRSVSMTRLDQLAQPRKHYVEANKASSTTSSAASSALKDVKSPTRPLSSASEQSGGSGRLVTRRITSSPRKPRPVSIAGTVPDVKPFESRVSPIKKTVGKKPLEVRKAPVVSKAATPKSAEKPKVEKPRTSTPVSKPSKSPAVSKTTPKVPLVKKTSTNKKKADVLTSVATPEPKQQPLAKSVSPPASPPPPDSAASEAERNNAKRIISEEEAKAALAEKRRLVREQAEKEAEIERQRQEDIKRQEEEKLRKEEEEQKRMEEEQLHLLEEHRKQEEEKLRKAIEENERKEEEERLKREEELRLKAEQEKKAHEEAEKQRIELEEKLRKEEEERAERKKRLEKIMSRTRGKSANVSPSGSMSGSEQLDSAEQQQDAFSSGANSLESNETGEVVSGPPSLEDQPTKAEPASDCHSVEVNPTYEVASDSESLQGMMMPGSETASQDNSLVIVESADIKSEQSNNTAEVEKIPELAEYDASKVEEVFEKPKEKEETETVKAVEDLVFSATESEPRVLEETIISEVAKTVENIAISPSGDIFQDSEDAEPSTPFSTSSDIKLPDPIYETSDDGSVSSERHQHDFNMYGLQEDNQHLESQLPDDVFGEKEILLANPCPDSNPLEDSHVAFENLQNFSMQQSFYASETPDTSNLQNFSMQQSFYASEIRDTPLETIEQRIDTENTSSVSVSNILESKSGLVNDIEEDKENIVADVSSNPFGDFAAPDYADKENTEFAAQSQFQENIFIESEAVISEQNLPFKSSNEISDITLVKSDTSSGYIGMISSVEHDRVSNDLAEQSRQTELIKSNFEYSSMTESENSSLDSNLSQVMPGEISEGDVTEVSKSAVVLQNGQTENPFNGKSAVNGSANGDHFLESEVISNGHRMEFSESGDGLVQLEDSKHISSVDHSKNNIFDNVDAVEFGKVSPDPFLVKGNSNQIPGNPFLMQDDQKPVLMTPDFFN